MRLDSIFSPKEAKGTTKTSLSNLIGCSHSKDEISEFCQWGKKIIRLNIINYVFHGITFVGW